MMGSSHAAHREDLDVSDATFATPDLSRFCRLDERGLVVTSVVDPATLEATRDRGDRETVYRAAGA